MGIKKCIARATVNNRRLQKKCIEVKKSWDEVYRLLGAGKKGCGHKKK